jgi:hypothetical protein
MGALELLAAPPSDAVARTAGEQAYLTDLGSYVKTLGKLAASTRGALRAQIGKTITLHMGGDEQSFQVIAVTDSRISGRMQTDNGEQDVTIEVAKLPITDRILWLEAPHSPEEHALHFILNRRGGRTDAAREHAAAAGLFAEAFASLIPPGADRSAP